MSLFLGCNDMTTATYFSNRSGEVTVSVSSVRKKFKYGENEQLCARLFRIQFRGKEDAAFAG